MQRDFIDFDRNRKFSANSIRFVFPIFNFGNSKYKKTPDYLSGVYIKESKIREYKVMYERIKEISPFFRRQRLEQRRPEQDNNNRLLHVFQIPLLPVPGNEDSQTARLLLQPVPFRQ